MAYRPTHRCRECGALITTKECIACAIRSGRFRYVEPDDEDERPKKAKKEPKPKASKGRKVFGAGYSTVAFGTYTAEQIRDAFQSTYDCVRHNADPSIAKNFGDVLRYTQWLEEVSIPKLSRLTGISTTSIMSWRKGLLIPQPDKLLLIANILNIRIQTHDRADRLREARRRSKAKGRANAARNGRTA